MSDPADWVITTHDWTTSLDVDHLHVVRERARGQDRGGIRHLVLEVLAYADDEAQAQGRQGEVVLTHHPDGSVSVRDNGRGTDTRQDSSGRMVRKPVMATRDVRFFDSADAPLLADGLPRQGMSSVSARCTWLVHENRRGGQGWTQTYRYGSPDAALRSLADPTPVGTTVHFLADDEFVQGPRRLTKADSEAFAWIEITVDDLAP